MTCKALKEDLTIPIYKANGKKDGLQKYIVRINYLADNGQPKQLTRVAYGLDEAKNLEMRLNDKIKNKKEMPIKKIKIQQLFDEYIKVKKYEIKELSIVKIINNFNYYILPTYRNYRIDKVNINMLQDWKISMEEKNLSLNTKSGAFIDFKAIFNYAIKMEYLQKNPFEKLNNFIDRTSIIKKMQYYTAEEFKIFITKVKEVAEEKERLYNDLSEWNFYIFFNIAFYTGLRKGEIHALKWSDINGYHLSVERSITQRLKGGDRETRPKNQSSIRTLQIPLPLMKVLEKHKQRQRILHHFTDDFRICNSIRDTTIKRRNDDTAKALGLKILRIHDFRHSHVSVLANEGINIQEVSRRLGHSRIEITWNTYSHLYPREEERAVLILNSITC